MNCYNAFYFWEVAYKVLRCSQIMHRTRQTTKSNQGLFPKILSLLNSDEMTMIKKAPNSIRDASLYFLNGSLLCVGIHHQLHIL